MRRTRSGGSFPRSRGPCPQKRTGGCRPPTRPSVGEKKQQARGTCGGPRRGARGSPRRRKIELERLLLRGARARSAADSAAPGGRLPEEDGHGRLLRRRHRSSLRTVLSLATLQCTAPAWVPYLRINSHRVHYGLMYGTEPVPYILSDSFQIVFNFTVIRGRPQQQDDDDGRPRRPPPRAHQARGSSQGSPRTAPPSLLPIKEGVSPKPCRSPRLRRPTARLPIRRDRSGRSKAARRPPRRARLASRLLRPPAPPPSPTAPAGPESSRPSPRRGE
jgi:hypothetical protein